MEILYKQSDLPVFPPLPSDCYIWINDEQEVDRLFKVLNLHELNVSRWLEAHCDRSAGLNTLPGSAVLADVSGDGDHRLVLVDLKFESNLYSRLKVYKGPILHSDQILPDVPSSLISFYTDNFEPRVPAVAIACGSDLLIYKNTKPYFKFTVPNLPLTALEQDVWRKIREESNRDLQQIVENLKSIPYGSLSARSQHLLSKSNSEMEEFVEKYSGTEPTKESPIICMSTIKKCDYDSNAVSCPILATESGQIYILDPQSFSILHQAAICNTKSTPFTLKAVGLFDVEFRIFVACREGYICVLRRGWLEGNVILQTTTHIVDMVIIPGDNFITIATTDKMLHCYTKRGHKLWGVKMINSVTCLCLVPLKHLSTHLVAVGLRGGPIHLYQGRYPVDFISSTDTASTIIFGQLGQEEHVMVIITLAGTLNFKILKRTADFNQQKRENSTPPALQTKPLPLPKRSKLFLEQSLRERQNAVEMHQTFQQDLIRLRLQAARAMVQSISDQSGIGNEKEQIKLSAQVLGLGPKFTLILTLENMNSDKPLIGLTVIFHAKPTWYTILNPLFKAPLIPPGLSYKIETKVTEILNENPEPIEEMEENINRKIVRVFVIKQGQSQPILAASINMPPTDIYGF